MWGWSCQDVFRKLRRINRTFGIRGSWKECEYSMSCLAVSIEGWQVLEWRWQWRWELLGRSGGLLIDRRPPEP